MSDRVVPVLRLAVLCEDVVFDGDGFPFALEVPIHTLQLARGEDGRIRPPELMLYLQLADGVGTFYVAAELRNEAGTVSFRSRPPAEVVFDGTAHRHTPRELVLTLTGIELPDYGLYELRVLCNHLSLHDPSDRTPVPYPPVRVSAVQPEEGNTP